MMLVQHILDSAQRRLAVVSWDAPVITAAKILANPATPLIVVCESAGGAIGVITRTHLIKLFGRGAMDVFAMHAGDVMTQPLFACHEDESLQFVWAGLNARSLQCVPILDASRKPLGIVHARDVVKALLDELTYEELLLRDYVLGVGYR